MLTVALGTLPDILAPMLPKPVPSRLRLVPALILLAISSGAFVARTAAQAVVEGTVPLPKQAVRLSANERYQVKGSPTSAPEGPVAVVYLEGNFPATATPPVLKAEVWQRDFQFSPTLLPVLKGTRVEFPNGDDGYHNVFSYSKVKRFDLGRYRKGEEPAAVVFDQAGTVKLYCEIHEHMRATILVLETPHFTTADATGKFTLEQLPAGAFTLKAWLDDKKILEQPVTLKDGETLHVDFTSP